MDAVEQEVKRSRLKKFLFGKPFPNRAERHERLDKVRGLAIFASDPISSNAYATEAIMTALLVLGSGALVLTLPVGMAVAGLVLIVVFSYIQTIQHYPDGGGAYTVTKDNLGVMPSLFAAAALLTDYVLTVSVSVSAGIRAVTSAFPELIDYRVILALVAILLLTWINLRGVRESGTLFAFPTYAFVGGVLLVIVMGLARQLGLFGLTPIPVPPRPSAIEPASTLLFIWIILRAFAAGTTALTGIEAISNGIPAFKPPESRNASLTMVAMAACAMSLFVGINYLGTTLHLSPSEEESILSQLARAVSGTGVLYYWVQIFTTLILILAANTGYQDFPRLSSFLARDGFLPRWMQNRGDRLVFNSGILTLAILAAIIVMIFRADEIAMLPLYALGVMLSFTLSQFGMVRLMGKVGRLSPGESTRTNVTLIHYEGGWRWKRLVNLVGGVTTGVVLIVLLATKFIDGAWLIVLAIPLLVLFFRAINRSYQAVAEALTTRDMTAEQLNEIADVVIVPIADVHRGTLRALRYALRISNDVRAVCIVTDEATKERVQRRWDRFPEIANQVQLVMIDYAYRDILTPLVEYIGQVNNVEFPSQLVSVVVPEFVPESLMEHLLHNQTASLLRLRLRGQKDVVVIDLPYHVRVRPGDKQAGE
ncbi:MAG: APC family permease [Chloroflexota bacterium]|jgi:amino acid transporter